MSEVPIQEDTQPFSPVREYDVPRQSRGGCGCWLPALVTFFLVAILVVVGLFLPPVNLYNRLFGTQYTMLNAQSNAVRSPDENLTLILNPEDPGKDFGVALSAVSMNDFTSGSSTAGEWIPAALGAAPPYLALQSQVYSIQTTGTTPDAITLSVNVPTNLNNPDIVDLYAWDAKTAEWRFVSSQVTAPNTRTATVEEVPEHLALFQASPLDQPTVLASVDAMQVLSPEVGQLATIIAPGGLQPTLEGKLTGSLAAGFELNRGYLVMPVIRNFTDPLALDTRTVSAIIGNRATRSEHISQLTAFASSGGFAGVMIDYRDLPADQRDNFSAFIRELGQRFDEQGLLLGVVVPSAKNLEGAWETGAYDWRIISSAADYVQIDMGLDPATFTPGSDRLVEAMLRWAIGEVSRYKILLGLSAQSVRQIGADFVPVSYEQALAGLGNVSVEAQKNEDGTIRPGSEIQARLDGAQAISGVDTTIESPFIDFLDTDGNAVARIWLMTPEALRFRMNRTHVFGLAGVAFEDLLAEGVAGGVLDAVLSYKLQTPTTPTAKELALRWRIQGVNGLLGEITTGLTDKLVTTIEAPDGPYAINVAVEGASGEVPRGGVEIALAQPTQTPTPVPTLTPTPVPTNTPIPATVAPVVSAPSGGGASAAAPGAGSIVAGTFEYGGHVTSTASDNAANAMRRAGMNWMKIQIRYSGGMSPSVASAPINDAHARGFKVLLAIPGVPGELGAGGAGYIQQYTQFLGGVAALGPDAIEVWNEPNIDREWPTGQISGATFADMLRQAYQAIKGANGSVMVISGAPAPTGAEAAFPGRVVNDDRFVREMMAAGAAQWMDCLGAHYNEGIVGPSQRSGDPRDSYYTRYFFGMLDTYASMSGGKPICFTELGYLSSEGYGPLPSFFAWAQNVTVAQQAAWLAEAAALASQSGKVRLMIVWNVDFSNYGEDPMGGYAMIRPGGGCPACDAMAGAR